MKSIDCWAVDIWDGGDRQVFGFYLARKEDADEWKLTKGKHDHIRPVTLTVFDSLEELEQNSHAKLKKAALAKLTPQERVALGFPPH